MGLYKHLKELLRNKESLKKIQRERLIEWRKQPSILRVENPTNLIAARSLGYRAKKGILLIRVKLKRGGKQRPQIKKGRRSKHYGRRKVLGKNYQWIAEERAQKYFSNLEVLNSYKAGKDGKNYWFEIIMVDPHAPEIKSDKILKWLTTGKHTKRVLRGKTSAGQKARGLLHKGKGTEKVRPSLRAHKKRAK